ncbi:MAG TPA: hypothetical protein VJ816_00635 [Gemmatimonadales bacterium]|nr:hypothetical protein [Gemmatimonadales bacterium]
MSWSTRPTVTLVALFLGVAARASAQADPDRAVPGGGTMPAGWNARTDGNAPLTNVKFEVMNPGQHVTLGPAAIFWRDADSAAGAFSVEATFWQFAAPRHREGYGLFIGGANLTGPTQRYTYFIVAGTGEFLVKRRSGDSTAVVSGGWTTNAAVAKQDSAGKVKNTLTIRVANGKASFLVNGTEVYTTDAANVDVSGIVGYRVNHNLNVHLGPLTRGN